MPATKTNLPTDRTSFVGRTREIAEVRELVETRRAITIVGAGGCGKTRLAIHVAAALVSDFADGVWLVELAPVQDSSLVPQAIAAVLGVRADSGRPMIDVIASYLANRHVLLVLDNCEHVVDACTQLIEHLLATTRDLRILATSREPVRASGEHTWRVPSLAVPDETPDPNLDQLARSEAVQLFVERARARNHAFAMSRENAAAITIICRRLDGIPLAIELAAALVPSLTVELVAAHLDDALHLLVAGSRTVSRQSTLRATLDWSYTLLSGAEQRMLESLSVFDGGFDVEAAHALYPPNASLAETAGLVASLVDKSLVVGPAHAAGRFRLLETVRQYARERLRASGNENSTHLRHALHFLALAEANEPRLTSGERDKALAQLDANLGNLRAALRWAWAELPASGDVSTDRRDLAIRLATSLTWYWLFQGYVNEGSTWARRAAQAGDAAPLDLRARAFFGAGVMAWLSGDYVEGRRWLDQSAALQQDLGNRRGRALTLAIRGMMPDDADQAATLARLAESIALAGAICDDWVGAIARQVLGVLAFHRGNLAEAKAYLSEGRELFHRLGDGWFEAQALNSLGDLARSEGDFSNAEANYRRSLDLFAAHGRRSGQPSILQNLGHVALRRGDSAAAGQLFRESLALFHEQGDQRGVAESLIGLAGVTGATGQAERAAWLFGKAQASLDAVGASVWPSNLPDYHRYLADTRAQIDRDAFARAWDDGAKASLADALAVVRRIAPAPNPNSSQPPAEEKDPDGLTRREREVAALAAQGMSNREIADTLVISEGTAALHVKHILAKLDVSSRGRIAAWFNERASKNIHRPNSDISISGDSPRSRDR
jgi:non-specific serine/threonine protein kinase